MDAGPERPHLGAIFLAPSARSASRPGGADFRRGALARGGGAGSVWSPAGGPAVLALRRHHGGALARGGGAGQAGRAGRSGAECFRIFIPPTIPPNSFGDRAAGSPPPLLSLSLKSILLKREREKGGWPRGTRIARGILGIEMLGFNQHHVGVRFFTSSGTSSGTGSPSNQF